MSIQKTWRAGTAVAGLALLVAACGGEGDAGKAVTSDSGSKTATKFDMSKPVELTFYSEIATPANDNDFTDEFGQYIQKKYPNVKFTNNVYTAQTKKLLEDTISEGTKFDLAKTSIVWAYKYFDAKVSSDISDLIKKHNVDISGINPVSLQQIKDAGKGNLVGLPYQINTLILYYNKSIFDKFGVPYPKENMTWQDVAEAARKLYRQDGGVQYIGFANHQRWGVTHRINQLSLEPVDLKTNKVTFGNGKWKQLFEAYLPVFQAQGGVFLDTEAKVDAAFFKDQNLAMTLAYTNYYSRFPETLNLNWDMTSAPSLPEKQGVGYQPVPSLMAISANSPHRDEAFLVAMEIVSKSVQLERAKKFAYVSVLTDPEIRQSIGTGIPQLQGKNTKVMQPASMATSITYMPYTNDAMDFLQTAMNNVITGKQDVNTALREAEEGANQKIAEKIAAEKK